VSVDVESAQTEFEASAPEVVSEPYQPYRALCTASIVSMALAVLSPFAFVDFWLGIIPAFSILLGVVAEWRIRQRPEELTGAWLSRGATVVAALAWAAGAGWLTYVYVTEVPEGYQRVSYSQLQPNTDVPGEIVPPAALDFDGQKVFIKGYALQGTQQSGIKEFVLVRDRGDCCFGGNPKLTDQIYINLAEPYRLSWSTRVQRLAGVFRVEPVLENGHLLYVYHLDAEYLK
jgi:hypothetical protein